jgi:rhodanese-related sulfurtransferase
MHPQPQRRHVGQEAGYKNVYRYPGGIKAWMEAAYPVEKAK